MVEAEVFSDPVYCNGRKEGSYYEVEECDFLEPTEINEPRCRIFDEILDIHVSEHQPFPLKCDECKEAYQKAS